MQDNPSGRPRPRWALRAGDIVMASIAVAMFCGLAATALPPILHNAVATLAELRDDAAGAERHLWAAVDRGKRFGARESVVTALERLASLYEVQGRHADAERVLLELHALREEHLGEGHPALAEVAEELGIAARRQGRPDVAERWFRRSLEQREAALGPRHPQTASAFLQLGSLYRAQRELRRADLYLGRAQSILEEDVPDATPLLSFALIPGRPDAAGTQRLMLAAVLYELSAVRGAQRQLSEARQLAMRAGRLAGEGGLSPALEIAALSQLGALHQAEGDAASAFESFTRARELIQRHGLEGSRVEGALLNNVAVSEVAAGREARARSALESALRITRQLPASEDPLAVSVSWNSAMLARHRERMRTHPAR